MELELESFAEWTADLLYSRIVYIWSMIKLDYCLRSWDAIWVSKFVFCSFPIYPNE